MIQFLSIGKASVTCNPNTNKIDGLDGLIALTDFLTFIGATYAIRMSRLKFSSRITLLLVITLSPLSVSLFDIRQVDSHHGIVIYPNDDKK